MNINRMIGMFSIFKFWRSAVEEFEPNLELLEQGKAGTCIMHIE